MTKRKSLWTRVTSFMAAMVFSMTLLLVFPENTFTVTADSVITAEEANMIITGVIELNGVPLAEGSEVKNGDVLSLDVNWSLPDDFENVNGTFSYDLTDKLFGITLDDIVIPVGNTAVYQVKDNVLYIKLLAGHSNRYGDCSLSGSVNVAEDEVGDGGSFELKFIGTPEGNNDTVPVTVTNYVPGLSVSKTASGSVTYENGTYYQSFNISLSSYNQESTGVKISDLADSGYDFSQLTDFTVKYNGYGMEAVDYTLTNTANGFDIEINSPVGTEWGEYITIGYKVPVDVYDVINGTETAVNKITATADNQTEKDDTAKASITEPIISKIGSYDSEAGTITWTITVYPNTLTAENPSFVITEIPGKNLDEDELKAIFGDDMQITSDELTLVDGKYVLTYTTTAESSPIQDTYYSNSAKVKFENIDKEYTTSEMTVYVPKSLSDFVEKTYSMPNADGTIPWSIKVSLPDADVTNISIYDYTDNYSIAMNQSMFTVTGADGTVGTIASSKDTMSSDDVGYANWYGSQIDFDITDSDFLAANKGKDIVVNYTMTLPEGVTSIQNTASVTLTIDGVAVNDYDTETFAPDFTASKYTNIDMSQFTQDESYNFPILWGIRIKGDEHFVAGDTIVAEDTIPDGLEFIDGAVIVCVDSDNGYGTNFSNLLTTTVLGNTVKFELTVTEKLINETMKYDDGSYTNVMPIRIVYLTYADDDVTAIYQNGSKTYTNSASVTVNNVPVGTVTAEKTITAQTGDVVTKEAVSTGVEGDNVGAYTYAEYQIVINPDAVKLSNNTTITATDTLGANLTLVGTPVITPTDGASFSYSGNVLDFILNDETTYTITYRVKVSTVDKDKVENGSYTDEQLTDMFGNTIIVDVAGSTDFSTSSPFSVINYTHDASFSFDEQEKAITIKGTKSWEQDDKDIDARPSKIVITLTAKRYDTNGTYLSSATSTYEVDAPADNGAWEYTIENLPTLEPDTGVTIKYDVTEIKADGYSVTYDDGNQTGITRVDDDTTEYTVDITNTFTAVSDEVGSLTVTKEWVGDTESDRPEINITVVDVSGNGSYSQTKTLSGNSVIFENLPLYIYSRDADDNLVRELRYYAITEAVVNANDQSMLDNYTLTKSYEGDSFALTDKIEANYALTTAVEQTLTNTYSAVTPAETISISGAKTWDDNNDQDGKRPTSITVKLMNGETLVESKNVTEADNWEYSFTGLDKYSNGVEIAYTIEEVAVDGYTTTYNGYDITNTYTTETISISGTKTWDDNNDQDGKRPTSITVNLMNGETLVESKNVTAADNWEYTFDNLAKYDGGNEIVYSVEEVAVDGYTTTYNGYDITNTYTTETISISGTKTWDDSNDQDGKRPTSITVKLMNGETLVESKNVTATDNWEYTFTGLDKYSNGVEIVYSVEEVAVDGYTTTYNGYDITNTYTTETISISGTKTWDDNNDQDGKRPTSITVNLMNGETLVESKNVTATDNWEYTFDNLAKYDGGNEIVYSVEEVAVDGYVTSYNGYDITNTYTTETISISGAKTWEDNNDQDGKRPTSITVKLMNGETFVESKNVTEADNWEYTFADLAKYDGGNEIVYTIEEVAVDGYVTSYNGYDITNTYTTETISISGTKTWDDNNDQDGKRPTSITVNLMNGETLVESKNVTAADNWEYTFDNLAKYDGGNEIVYSVEEVAVDGYTTTYNGYDITNTYTTETISISGTKTWDDSNNQDGKRPTSITVNLYGNGTYVDSKTVTAADNWEYSFTGLDKYSNGKLITYSVAEEAVYGYTPVYNGYDITNVYTFPYISVQVTKVWDDDNNRDGKRPESVNVVLSPTGDTVALSAANNWTYIFKDLPAKDADDNDINYTVTEDSVDGYTATYNGYDITNTRVPETTSVSGTKTWDDSNDQNGKRPTSITVNLYGNGTYVDSKTVTEADNWEYSFDNLYMYENGVKINYTVTEDNVDGYTATYNGYDITNTYTTVVTPAETVDISVTKTWDDSNDADGIRPTELEITLKRDGVAIQTMKSDWVKNGNTWTYTFTGLPKYPTGSTTEYVYTVEEEDLTAIGYTGSSTSTQYSFGFVNKYTSTTPNTPNVPNVPSVPNPVNPTVPNTPVTPFIPQAPEDVSSESGIDAESDMLGSVDTSSFTFIAILLAITAGGIVIARRRQK